jgi:hypothetical protein
VGFPSEERFVAAAEAALGVVFPAALRARLLGTNGGELELGGDAWLLHPVRDDRSPKHVARWDHETGAVEPIDVATGDPFAERRA